MGVLVSSSRNKAIRRSAVRISKGVIKRRPRSRRGQLLLVHRLVVRTPTPASLSVPQGSIGRMHSNVGGRPTVPHRAVLIRTEEKGKLHANQVQERRGMYREQFQMLCKELLG